LRPTKVSKRLTPNVYSSLLVFVSFEPSSSMLSSFGSTTWGEGQIWTLVNLEFHHNDKSSLSKNEHSFHFCFITNDACLCFKGVQP
jgi:hypothetical protein